MGEIKGVTGQQLSDLCKRYPDYVFKSLPIALCGAESVSDILCYNVDPSEKIVTVYL